VTPLAEVRSKSEWSAANFILLFENRFGDWVNFSFFRLGCEKLFILKKFPCSHLFFTLSTFTFTHHNRSSAEVKEDEVVIDCPSTDNLGKGWRYIKKTRRSGKGSYRSFISPDGKRVRTLKEARRLHNEAVGKGTAKTTDAGPNEDDNVNDDVNVDNVSASFSNDSDIDAESSSGEVASIKSLSDGDGDIFSIDDDDDEDGDDDDDDDDDDEPESMINDGADNAGESLFGECSTEELDRKSKIMIEDSNDGLSIDNKKSSVVNQRKNKLIDNADINQNKNNAPTFATMKKAKLDKSDVNVANGLDGVNQHDASSFATPKRNLFPEPTGNLDDRLNEIEVLQRRIDQLKRAKSAQEEVSDAAGKLNDVVGVNVSAPAATQPSVVSEFGTTPDVVGVNVSAPVATQPSVVSEFATTPTDKLPVYKSPSSKNQQNGSALTCEVSSTFTNKNTGENVNLIVLHGGGSETWFIKSEVLNEVARHLLAAPLGGNIASVFTSWSTTFYRAVPCGLNNIHRRTPQYNQTSDRPAYPSTKLITIMSNPPSGFTVKTHVVYFQNQLRAMMTKSRVPAHFLHEHIKCEIPILYTKFLAGSYRRDGHKNIPYNDESELKKYFDESLQRTFKNEFRFVYDITLDKYLPDSGIKNFLISLGYNGFDEVKEDERKNIYLSGNYPNWLKIEQEPLN